MKALSISLWVALAGLAAPAANVCQWDFNGDLASSTGGAALSAEAAAPAASAGVTFTTASIGGQTARVAAFTRGTCFRLTNSLPANGGGSLLNQYTLILDVMFPSRPTGWAALLQTSPQNANDAEWFINSTGGLGISGVYGGSLANGAWNRLALVVDSAAGTFTSYLNGVSVQQSSGVTTDGRWALEATALLFADEDQENAAGYVNSVQLRGRAMDAAELAALGGPQAAGIPLPPDPSGLQIISPNGGETLQAGSTRTVAWTVSNPDGLVQVDLLLGDALYRSLGQVLMGQSNFLWSIDPRLGDANSYRIRLSSLSCSNLLDVSDAAFSVAGSGVAPNLAFGQSLLLNGGFESLLAGWQVMAGSPAALTTSGGKGAPYAGSCFLFGGFSPGGDMVLRQDIDLQSSGFAADDLDAGAAVDAKAWLRNAYATGTFDDQAYLRVAYLDSQNRELGSVRTLVAGASGWVQRSATGVLPAGARRLRVEVVGKNRRDTANDSMADEVSVCLQRAWPAVNPRIIALPILQDYRPNAMTLLWETDGNLGSHAVDWGRASVSEQTLSCVETVQLDSSHFIHRATLAGLAPETSYVYRVRSGASVSAAFSFRTAPRRDTPFAVAWWGDSQENPAILRQLLPGMLAHGADWLGIAGDMVSSGASLSDWSTCYFASLATQNAGQTRPVLFARGNHDGEHPFCYANSALPGNEAWYAFDYGNSRFIFLDSEAATSAVSEQYAWLTNELARPETQNAAFRIVCFHRLPYCDFWNGSSYTGETWVRNNWTPLFQQYHVDAVINGHSHYYNRGATNGVTYLVVGGGGGALDTERVASWSLFSVEYSRYHYGLMQINGPTLTWNAFDTNGLTFDSFTLRSRTPSLEWQATRPAGGVLPLRLAGKPGSTYVLERSADLVSWSPFLTNTVPAAGPFAVSNAIPATDARIFVRARAVP
jgi:hypothetical protein